MMFSFFNENRAAWVGTRVRLANTSRTRRTGLLKETSLAEQQGLWITPCEAIHTFGMKMPIDSVFLDKELRVRGLRHALKPRRIALCLRAHSVLELPAGTLARSGTQLGDKLTRRVEVSAE